MKTFKLVKHSTSWSISRLNQKVEDTLHRVSAEGWEVVSVAFGVNLWYMPTAFITLSRNRDFV